MAGSIGRTSGAEGKESPLGNLQICQANQRVSIQGIRLHYITAVQVPSWGICDREKEPLIYSRFLA